MSISKDNVTVAIFSTLTVPLVMPVLDSIEDGGLRKEIAEEAVRLSIMENLCGFDGVTVEEGRTTIPNMKGTFQYRADVDFQKLARCIAALQSEYQRVVGIAKDMQDVVAHLQGAAASNAELIAPLKVLSEGIKSISEPDRGSENDGGDERADMPELEEERDATRRLLDGTESDASDEGPSDPEARGYARMSDD
jgi:hypothetical protein